MADLSHELGALRFVVDSPLSSKVAMFNNHVAQHKTGQLLNPFSQTDGSRCSSPKPDITKDDYGKPLAGSLTEMRGQKANMHVLREMLELCQIIDSEGYNVKDEPNMRVITFGELFNIYNYISDKCVGILLRARKHKLLEFEGEMLFQRRDDDVPIFLLRPVAEIRREMNEKIDVIKRGSSPAPQSTSVLLDKKALGLSVPASRNSMSRTPSPQTSKSGSPVKEIKAAAASVAVAAPAVAAALAPTIASAPVPVTTNGENPKIQISGEPEPEPETVEPSAPQQQKEQPQQEIKEATTEVAIPTEVKAETPQQPSVVAEAQSVVVTETQPQTSEQPEAPTEETNDVNNNPADVPTVVVEATAVYVRSPATAEVNANPTPEAAVA